MTTLTEGMIKGAGNGFAGGVLYYASLAVSRSGSADFQDQRHKQTGLIISVFNILMLTLLYQ